MRRVTPASGPAVDTESYYKLCSILAKTVLMIFSRLKYLRVFHSIRHGTRKRGHRVSLARKTKHGKNKLCHWDAFSRHLAFEHITFFQFNGLLQIFPDIPSAAAPVKEFLTDVLSQRMFQGTSQLMDLKMS